MLMRLSEITPSPTQRFIPLSPLYRQRLSPCLLLVTLMRPSHPVRHFWPLRNQRFFCSRRRSLLLLERLGNAYSFDTLGFCSPLVFGGVEAGIFGHQIGCSSQFGSVRLDGGDQQVRVVRTLGIDCVVDNDLVFRLLQLHHLAELVGLGRLALADQFRRRLEQA